MNSCPVKFYNFNNAKIKYVSVGKKIAEKKSEFTALKISNMDHV